jgi:hypothetical protein
MYLFLQLLGKSGLAFYNHQGAALPIQTSEGGGEFAARGCIKTSRLPCFSFSSKRQRGGLRVDMCQYIPHVCTRQGLFIITRTAISWGLFWHRAQTHQSDQRPMRSAVRQLTKQVRLEKRGSDSASQGSIKGVTLLPTDMSAFSRNTGSRQIGCHGDNLIRFYGAR